MFVLAPKIKRGWDIGHSQGRINEFCCRIFLYLTLYISEVFFFFLYNFEEYFRGQIFIFPHGLSFFSTFKCTYVFLVFNFKLMYSMWINNYISFINVTWSVLENLSNLAMNIYGKRTYVLNIFVGKFVLIVVRVHNIEVSYSATLFGKVDHITSLDLI